jgi:GNAT superfamily N-acetyltransferase
MIVIRRATVADAAALADVAASTFRDTFGPDNRPEDLNVYLTQSYGVRQQTAELNDPAIVTLLAFDGSDLVGYAQLRHHDPPVDVPAQPAIELWRFYVIKSWHGRGVAPLLMEAATLEAASSGARTLWLGVWDPQTDRVMALTLRSDASGGPAAGRA